MKYTTYGSIRGGCSHRHDTYAAAERCAERDQRDCHRAGGYSDRTIRELADDVELTTRDVHPGLPDDVQLPLARR